MLLSAVVASVASPPAVADFIGHGGMVRSVAVSPDGARVLTASFDYSVKLWAFSDQDLVRTMSGHTAPVNAVAFVADGRTALSAGDDGTLIHWDVETGAPRWRTADLEAKLSDIAVAPDGAVAATVGWDGLVRLWNLDDGAEIASIHHDQGINAVASVRNGTAFATGDKAGVIRIWEASGAGEWRKIAELAGHTMAVTDLVDNPGGRSLLSTGIDGAARLWDLDTGLEIVALRGHDGPVLAAAVSADGAAALTAGRDGQVIVWSLASGLPKRSLAAHDEPVWSVAFTPDGRFGVSAGSDGSVRVWHLESGARVGLEIADDTEPRPWETSTHPGARLYRACARCHTLSPDGISRSGPHLAGLFGRRVGSVPGYDYSPTLRRATFTWNRETLTALFAEGPHAYVPDSKMPLQRVSNPEDLSALVDYLEELTAPRSGKTP
ncbi:MAG: hypothetical protein IPM60_02410 [Rhodospirillales bacterium]|nr:hypothetical protein [Rhodospirillales bacterium]